MSGNFIKAAFMAVATAVAVAGASYLAGAFDSPQIPDRLVLSLQQGDLQLKGRVVTLPSTLEVGGPSIPAKAARAMLERDHWHAVAGGYDSPETGFLVLRQTGTNKIRLARLATGLLGIAYEGEIKFMRNPEKPYLNASFTPAASGKTRDKNAAQCFEKAWELEYALVDKAGQGPVIGFVSMQGDLMTIYAGLNKGNSWTLIKQNKQGASCVIGAGYLFRTDIDYPDGPKAAAPSPAPL